MPEVSRFFGMVIAMYSSDHAPPHFHVRVSGQDVTVAINDLSIIEGRLSPRLRKLVVKWAARHQEELRQNWIRAQQRAPLMRIPPLELSMYRDVVEVRPLNAYRLFVRFEDGNAGEIDITTLVPFDGVFAPLKDRQVFQSVRVNAEMGTIEWPSGADIDPVVLYCRVRGIPVPGEAQDTA